MTYLFYKYDNRERKKKNNIYKMDIFNNNLSLTA